MMIKSLIPFRWQWKVFKLYSENIKAMKNLITRISPKHSSLNRGLWSGNAWKGTYYVNTGSSLLNCISFFGLECPQTKKSIIP